MRIGEDDEVLCASLNGTMQAMARDSEIYRSFAQVNQSGNQPEVESRPSYSLDHFRKAYRINLVPPPGGWSDSERQALKTKVWTLLLVLSGEHQLAETSWRQTDYCYGNDDTVGFAQIVRRQAVASLETEFSSLCMLAGRVSQELGLYSLGMPIQSFYKTYMHTLES